VNNFVTVLLQINSGICVPKIIKIERDLTKLFRNKKGAGFLPHSIGYTTQKFF